RAPGAERVTRSRRAPFGAPQGGSPDLQRSESRSSVQKGGLPALVGPSDPKTRAGYPHSERATRSAPAPNPLFGAGAPLEKGGFTRCFGGVGPKRAGDPPWDWMSRGSLHAAAPASSSWKSGRSAGTRRSGAQISVASSSKRL